MENAYRTFVYYQQHRPTGEGKTPSEITPINITDVLKGFFEFDVDVLSNRQHVKSTLPSTT